MAHDYGTRLWHMTMVHDHGQGRSNPNQFVLLGAESTEISKGLDSGFETLCQILPSGFENPLVSYYGKRFESRQNLIRIC